MNKKSKWANVVRRRHNTYFADFLSESIKKANIKKIKLVVSGLAVCPYMFVTYLSVNGKKQKADELNPINQYFTFLFPLQIQQLGMNHCEEKCIIS